MKYIVVPEYISCVLLALIGVYMLFDKKINSPKEIAFRIALGVSVLAIVNNIFSIYVIENSARMPVLLNISLNTLYYFFVATTSALVAITTFITMFEGRYDERCLKVAVVISLSFYILEVAFVLLNLETGWLFYFDARGIYHRGPLSAVGILFLAIAIVNIIWVGVLERKRIRKSFRLILYILPSLGVVMGLAQYLFQTTILTGTIIGFALLTLFIAGQQQRAHLDALTELYNREAFFNDISHLCQKKTPYRIIIVGLKDFKQVNGQMGQRAGDAILVAVGAYLAHLDLRVEAYRTSGVQFTLVVQKMSKEEYDALFCRLIARF